MDCVGSTTSHSMMRACATRPSGRGRLLRPIRANSRPLARQTLAILTPTATPGAPQQRYFRWAWSCLETKVFPKGSLPVTTRPLLLGLELHGIRKEMVRLRCAAGGAFSTTTSNSWYLSSFKLSPLLEEARSFPRACLARHLFFKMELSPPIPLTGFSVRHTEPRPTGLPSDLSCCLENLNPSCARSTARSTTSESSVSWRRTWCSPLVT